MASGVSIYVGLRGRVAGYGDANSKHSIPRGYSDSREAYATFSFRQIPWASGVSIYVGLSGTAARSSNAVLSGLFGFYAGLGYIHLPWDSVNISGIQVRPYMSGRRSRKTEVRTLYFAGIFGF